MEARQIQLIPPGNADTTIELEHIIVELAKGNKSEVVTFDLEDNTKRWLVVGICLHSVLTPVLRQYVSNSMNHLFNKLKQIHNIDTQCYSNYLEFYPGRVPLKYESVNNNTGSRRNYDYRIKNAVDFSKLWIQPSMAKYTGFDDTCDSSALLNIIKWSDANVNISNLADTLRNDVRNPWAHCNFTEWNEMKYLPIFSLMKQLILLLHMPSEAKILEDLSQWEVNGIKFLQGNRLGPEIVDELQKHTQSLAQYVLQVKADVIMYSNVVYDSLLLISNEISNVCQRMDQTNRNVSKITDEVNSLNLRTDRIEQTENELVQDIKDIKDDMEDLKKYTSHLRPKGKVFFYPPDRVRVFVGRDDKLSSLNMKFLESKDVHHREVICGLGGCGKTTLSIEFAWMFQHFYPGGVFWISAESDESIEETISRLAFDISISGKNVKETLRRTLTWLGHLPKRWLLVIDNADAVFISSQMRELLLGTWKRNTRGHIIITTRREPLAVEESFHISKNDCNYLETLNEEEGVQFMIKRTEMSGDRSIGSIKKLVNELGGLPLALEQAAAHIKTIKCSFEDYLVSFEKRRLNLLSRKTTPSYMSYEADDRRFAVMTTWQLNMDYIRSQSEQEGLGTTAVVVMKVASFLFADDMPEEIFNSGQPSITDEGAYETLADQVGIKQVLEILTRFSLFQRYRSESLSVHRLVQEVIRSTVKQDEKKFVLQCAIRMINKALMATTTPYMAIHQNKDKPYAFRGLLNLWNKLAANANAIKMYIRESKNIEENTDICISLESVRIMQASAIYNSLFQRQDTAFEDQKNMLNIMASLDLDEDTYNDLTSIKIPLLERDRLLIKKSIATVLQDNDNENINKSMTVGPLPPDRLREMGNQAFKEIRYEDALQYYSEALRASPKNNCDKKILSNRSLVYLKLHDYTNALKDANACIKIDPYFWKAHALKSSAIAKLIYTNKMQPEMEGAGISSACIAAFLNEQCLLEYKMKVHYPILLYDIVQCEDENLQIRMMDISESPFTTYMLKKGLYTFNKIVKTTKSCQVIGVEPGVKIDIGPGIHVSRPLDSSFNIEFEREPKIAVHFENIYFCSNGSQVRVEKGGTASFYRCEFSSRFTIDEMKYNHEGKIDITYQKCVNVIDKTDKSYMSSISSSHGGRIFLNSCRIQSNRGFGITTYGEQSFLDMTNCNVLDSLIGIVVANGGEIKAIDNEICGHKLHGVAIGPKGKATLKRNIISKNKAEGIWSGGKIECKETYTAQTAVTAVDNTILQNGLSGICLEGGSFVLKDNIVAENWAWGIIIQKRSSVLAVNNEISGNKCGGIRVGINYSASVICDGNSIKDHSGPDILALNEVHHKEEAANIAKVDIYSTKSIITDRNLWNNNKPTKPVKNTVKSLKTCNCCQKMSSSLKACAKCRIARYCSKVCQTNHWISHKHLCKLLSEKYTIEIQIKDTKPNVQDTDKECGIDTLHPLLKGRGEGHPPDVKSTKRFIVKIQSDHLYAPYDPRKNLTLYDESDSLNLRFKNPELYHLCSEYGRLSGEKITLKKFFCWASYKKAGEILCIHTDDFPTFLDW